MSLGAFHIFFIGASIALAFGFGLWARRAGEGGAVAAAAFVLGAGLTAYLVWFLRKKA